MHGYERDSRVVPAPTATRFARPGCGDGTWADELSRYQRARARPRERQRDREGERERQGTRGRILSVNRNDNLAIDPLRERASRLIRADVHLVVLALRLPQVANRERSYCSPDCAELRDASPPHSRYRGCLAMTVSVNRELRCNPQ